MIYECVCSDGQTLSPWLSDIKTGYECPQTSPGTEWTRKTKTTASTTPAATVAGPEPYATPSGGPKGACRLCVTEMATEYEGHLLYWAAVDLYNDQGVLLQSVNTTSGKPPGHECAFSPYNTNITVSAYPLPYEVIVWFWQGSYDDNGYYHPYDPQSQTRRTITTGTPFLHDSDKAKLTKRVDDMWDFDLQFRIKDSETVWNTKNDRDLHKLPSCIVPDWENLGAQDCEGNTHPQRNIDCYFECPLVL
ncbi:hypothetical protein V8F20_012414 [Naviculisporaceae sp. PSN 640]